MWPDSDVDYVKEVRSQAPPYRLDFWDDGSNMLLPVLEQNGKADEEVSV